jgi:hypothetical protein
MPLCFLLGQARQALQAGYQEPRVPGRGPASLPGMPHLACGHCGVSVPNATFSRSPARTERVRVRVTSRPPWCQRTLTS